MPHDSPVLQTLGKCLDENGSASVNGTKKPAFAPMDEQ